MAFVVYTVSLCGDQPGWGPGQAQDATSARATADHAQRGIFNSLLLPSSEHNLHAHSGQQTANVRISVVSSKFLCILHFPSCLKELKFLGLW